MEILESEIKKIISDKEVKYLNNNRDHMRIKELKILCYEDDINYYIEGIVMQSSYVNSVKIVVDHNYKIVDFSCECPFSNHEKGCAHIALIIETINQLKPRVFPYKLNEEEINVRLGKIKPQKKTNNNQIRNVKINKFNEDYLSTLSPYQKFKRNLMLTQSKNFMEEHHSLLKQTLIPKIKNDMKLKMCYEGAHYSPYSKRISGGYFRVRIGNEKMYLIKNIFQFCDDIKKENNVRYGKELEFIHTRDSFDENSKLIIDFLNEYCNIASHYERKYLIIDEDVIDLFDNLIQKLNEDYYDFDVEDFDFKFELEVNHNYDYEFSLMHVYNDIMVSKYGFYSFDRRGFYRAVSNEMQSL